MSEIASDIFSFTAQFTIPQKRPILTPFQLLSGQFAEPKRRGGNLPSQLLKTLSIPLSVDFYVSQANKEQVHSFHSRVPKFPMPRKLPSSFIVLQTQKQATRRDDGQDSVITGT